MCAKKLAAYLRGSLGTRDRRRLEAHLDTCDRCARLLLELREVSGRLRGILSPSPSPSPHPSRSVLADGSLETPRVKPNTFQTFTAGQFLGPWKVTIGSVDLKDAGYWQAAKGKQSMDLNGNETGAVSQTFATVTGTAYTVRYALAGNSDGQAPAVKTGTVLIDGQNVQDLSFDATGKTHTDMGYVTRQVHFVATGKSTTLTFASTTPNAGGPVIDDVTVIAKRGRG